MLEGLMRALKILKEEHLSNYEEELLMEDLVEKLEGEILNIKKNIQDKRRRECVDVYIQCPKCLKRLVFNYNRGACCKYCDTDYEVEVKTEEMKLKIIEI